MVGPAAATRRLTPRRLWGLGAALLGGGTLALLSITPAPAAQPRLNAEQQAYHDGLVEARSALSAPGQVAAARTARALVILRARAPADDETLALLQADPPQVPEAQARLATEIDAFDGAADEPDLPAAQRHLRDILAQPRYHPENGPLAFIQRLVGTVLETILRALFGRAGGAIDFVRVMVALLVVALLILLLIPGVRGAVWRRGPRLRTVGATIAEDSAPEYFRQAEALAGRGDYAAAVRALAAGTMEAISGERSFVASPLTVRETFLGSGFGTVLRPLLLAFERSYYGHHAAAAADYLAGAAAAAEYHRLVAAEKAAA